MITVQIFKAQPIGDKKVNDVTIEIVREIGNAPTLETAALTFSHQAKTLESVLHDALPGGTYDQLLAAMLQRKASHFVVPFGGSGNR